jgi:mannose-6-phosphate isomerase-like protein (cupin superfamily)
MSSTTVRRARCSARRRPARASVPRGEVRPAREVRPGDTLANPVTGERFTFIETAASSGGARLAFELALAPGGSVPLPHVHPIQTERFAVTAGRMRFLVGLRTVHAGPGDVVEIPPGVTHAFANDGEEAARVRVDVTPALDMERMFAEVVALAEAGRMTRRGLPRSPLAFARLARTYDRVAHAPFIGLRLQRIALAPLVAAARHPRVAAAASAVTAAGGAGFRRGGRARAGLIVRSAESRPTSLKRRRATPMPGR